MADVVPLLESCKWLGKRAYAILGERRVGGNPFWLAGTKVWERREPLGHIGIIATWNYPVQLLGIQLAQALVAGNTVVVKPSERAPRTQLKLLDLALEAGLPPGTLTVMPATREAGEAMLTSGRFDHVIFTGSTEVGRAIARTIAPTLTPATLELSGRDSAIVLGDANPALAARAIWGAVCANSGQTCMGPRRALVHDAVYPAFVQELERLAAKSVPRSLIDVTSVGRCRELVADAVRAGGRLVVGGQHSGSSLDAARAWSPTAVVDCPSGAALVEGRHFGAVIAVVRVRSLDEAITLHEMCDQRLATSIYTKNIALAREIAPSLGSTTVTINDTLMPTAHPAVSVGGRGASGMGLSRGVEGLLAMTRPVYVSTGKHSARRLAETPPSGLVGMTISLLMRWYGSARYNAPASPRSTMRESAGEPTGDQSARLAASGGDSATNVRHEAPNLASGSDQQAALSGGGGS